MRIVPFQPMDLWELQVATSHNGDARPALLAHPECFGVLCAHAWSMEHEGRVVGCGGMVPRPEETVWWGAYSHDALKRPIAFCLVLKRFLLLHCREGRHVAHAQDETAVEWLSALGFREEDGIEFGQRRLVWRNER